MTHYVAPDKGMIMPWRLLTFFDQRQFCVLKTLHKASYLFPFHQLVMDWFAYPEPAITLCGCNIEPGRLGIGKRTTLLSGCVSPIVSTPPRGILAQRNISHFQVILCFKI